MTVILLQSLLVIVTAAATAVAVQNIQLRQLLGVLLLHLQVLRQQVRMIILVLRLSHQNLWIKTVMRYAHSSLYCFTFYLFLGTSLAVIAGSISGGVLLLVILVVALVLIYAKLRNKKSASIDDPLRRIGQSEIVYDEERDFLGSGCSGEVYRARLRKSSEVVAIKVFLKRRILPR